MAYQSVSAEMRNLVTRDAGMSTRMSEAEYKSEYPKMLFWAVKKYPKSPRSWQQFQGELHFWEVYLKDEFGTFPGDDPDPMESAYAEAGQIEIGIADEYVPVKRVTSLGINLRTLTDPASSNGSTSTSELNNSDTPLASAPSLPAETLLGPAAPPDSNSPPEGKYPFQCRHCRKTLSNASSLAKHQKIHDKEAHSFKCEDCGKTMGNAGALASHMKHHSRERGLSTIVVAAPPPSSQASPAASVSDPVPTLSPFSGQLSLTCDECGLVASSVSGLTRHKRIHTGQQPATSTTPNNLNTPHVAASATPVIASGLPARLPPSSSHTSSPSGSTTREAPHQCKDCGRILDSSYHLGLHMRTHTGERPCLCIECGESFNQPASLAKHRNGARHLRRLKEMETANKKDVPTVPATEELKNVQESSQNDTSNVITAKDTKVGEDTRRATPSTQPFAEGEAAHANKREASFTIPAATASATSTAPQKMMRDIQQTVSDTDHNQNRDSASIERAFPRASIASSGVDPRGRSRERFLPRTLAMPSAASPSMDHRRQNQEQSGGLSQLRIAPEGANQWNTFFHLNGNTKLPHFAALITHSNFTEAFYGPRDSWLKLLEAVVDASLPLIRIRVVTMGGTGHHIVFPEPHSTTETRENFVLDHDHQHEFHRLHQMLMTWASLATTILPNLGYFLHLYKNGQFGSPKLISSSLDLTALPLNTSRSQFFSAEHFTMPQAQQRRASPLRGQAPNARRGDRRIRRRSRREDQINATGSSYRPSRNRSRSQSPRRVDYASQNQSERHGMGSRSSQRNDRAGDMGRSRNEQYRSRSPCSEPKKDGMDLYQA